MARLGERKVVEPTDEIWSDKWVCLIILKDGRTLLGECVFDSEAEARQAIEDHEADLAVVPGHSKSIGRKSGQVLYLVGEYSHSIPIPFKQS